MTLTSVTDLCQTTPDPSTQGQAIKEKPYPSHLIQNASSKVIINPSVTTRCKHRKLHQLATKIPHKRATPVLQQQPLGHYTIINTHTQTVRWQPWAEPHCNYWSLNTTIWTRGEPGCRQKEKLLYFIQYEYHPNDALHNIIRIHNNVLWKAIDYMPTFNLNNVMCALLLPT